MIERWPHLGDEIQVWQMQTGEQDALFIRRDNRRRHWAIVKCMVKCWLGMK